MDAKRNEALSMCILARLSCSLCGHVSALPVSSVSLPSMPQAACATAQECISKNLQEISSFSFSEVSATLLSPPRHVLGFLGVLSPF